MARKVLISLVGGQPYPVYAQAIDLRPDVLLLIHSDRTELTASNIKNLIELKQPGIKVILSKLSATDHKRDDLDIKALATVWCKEDYDVWINLVGGTKHWSLMFYKHFSDKAHQILIDQNNNVIDINTLQESHVEPMLSIDDIFALHGVKVKYVDINSYTDEDFNSLDAIEKLRRINYTAFNGLVARLTDFHRKFPANREAIAATCDRKGRDYVCSYANAIEFGEDDNYIIWDIKSGLFECRMADKTHEMSQIVKSPHVVQLMLNTGWFEFKVATILAGWGEAEHVWLNCEIKAGGQQSYNELDVVVLTKSHKWLFIECKTTLFEPTNIDKFNEVVRKYSGIGSKKIFITEHPMKPNDQTRCALTQIEHFDTTSIMQGIRKFYVQLSDLMTKINPQ